MVNGALCSLSKAGTTQSWGDCPHEADGTVGPCSFCSPEAESKLFLL